MCPSEGLQDFRNAFLAVFTQVRWSGRCLITISTRRCSPGAAYLFCRITPRMGGVLHSEARSTRHRRTERPQCGYRKSVYADGAKSRKSLTSRVAVRQGPDAPFRTFRAICDMLAL